MVAKGFKTLRDQYGVNEIDVSELKTIKKLGEGAFATVEKCIYTPKSSIDDTSKTPRTPSTMQSAPPATPITPKPSVREVAVKKLKPEVVENEQDLNFFMAEVSLMRKLKHKNIVECECKLSLMVNSHLTSAPIPSLIQI